MDKRRVVISGMGIVSPNGVGREAFTQAILEGRRGGRRITRFDPSELNVQIAGEVTGFGERACMEEKVRRHVSRVLPLAIAGVKEALASSGLDPTQRPLEYPRPFGV